MQEPLMEWFYLNHVVTGDNGGFGDKKNNMLQTVSRVAAFFPKLIGREHEFKA